MCKKWRSIIKTDGYTGLIARFCYPTGQAKAGYIRVQ